ncbi:MAG: glycosyltransferase family 2 protein [Thermoanaerobaculia bacterium]
MHSSRPECLWLVMPVFNEEASIERVLAEWLPALREAVGVDLRVLAINDGSRDRTLEKLRAIERANPEVTVRDQANAGHGASCIAGYRLALSSGADWVLQIDSDGQCDPRYFAAFWEARRNAPVIFGYRVRRDDGWSRWAISRVVSLVSWLAAGIWVGDANVPYRLMRAAELSRAVEAMPADIQLANVLIALRLQRAPGIAWIPIRFRERHGGTPSIRAGSFAHQGRLLYRQLRAERRRVPT